MYLVSDCCMSAVPLTNHFVTQHKGTGNSTPVPLMAFPIFDGSEAIISNAVLLNVYQAKDTFAKR